MKTVEIMNVRAIKELLLEIPEEGGIVVLRGRNGAGKSSALGAVEAALRGTGSLQVRDGAPNGQVQGLGVKITVGRATRRSGELQVESLEGRLSLSDLIDPGQKSPDAADARRIKALCALAGAKPDKKLFSKLMSAEDFNRIVSTEAEAAEDLVIMADRIKRDIEKESRRVEEIATKYEGQSLAFRNSATSVEFAANALLPADQLQKQLEEAISYNSKIEERVKAFELARKQRDEASRALQDQGAKWDGPTADECQSKIDGLEAVVRSKKNLLESEQESVDRLTEALQAARQRLSDTKLDLTIAGSELESWKSKASAIAERLERAGELERQLNLALPEQPDAEEIVDSKADVARARNAVEQGVLARKSDQDLKESDRLAELAKEQREAAVALRAVAGATDEVLSDVVGSLGTALKVEAGRLVTQTDRGTTLFHELSPGERAKIAVDIAINQLGSDGVMVLDQVIFEGLDPINRRMLADHAKARKVVILTAEAADSDLQATTYAG